MDPAYRADDYTSAEFPWRAELTACGNLTAKLPERGVADALWATATLTIGKPLALDASAPSQKEVTEWREFIRS